ncbi:MAG: hypothetical protein ACJ736_26695 [Streptomyces sp.]
MANELKYGDQIYLQNGYNGWQGGYLDTINNHTTAGLKHYVATADSPTWDKGTGTWEIVSASGKAAGQPVLSGDLVHLRNLYAGDGGYLDTVNHATTAQKGGGGKYGVATAQSKDRTPGSGRWRILAQTSPSFDQNVRAGGSGPSLEHLRRQRRLPGDQPERRGRHEGRQARRLHQRVQQPR